MAEPIWAPNGWNIKLKPEVKTARFEHFDPTQAAGTLRDMATAGALLMSTGPIISQIRELLGVKRSTDMIGGRFHNPWQKYGAGRTPSAG